MNIASLHFSIKHVTPDQVRESVEKFFPNGITMLLHGFMPRSFVAENGYDTKWVDLIDEIAPNNASFFNPATKATDRNLLLTSIEATGAKSVFIGPIVDGVLEEYNAGNSFIRGIHYDPIKKVTDIITPPKAPTTGQVRPL